MSKYLFFIGCDISKNVIDVSYWCIDKAVYVGQFSNDEDGFLSIIKSVRSQTKVILDQWFVCFENTGSYSKSFHVWLYDKAIACIEENPLKVSKSMGMKRGKSDEIDSKDLCRYAFEKRDIIKASIPPSKVIRQLKQLNARRTFIVKQQTAAKVCLKEQKPAMDHELYAELKKENNILLSEYKRQIKSLESRIEKLLTKNKLVAQNYSLIRSVVGIGLITSAYLITTTNNFTDITDARKYASYSGIAPFENSSGIRKGRKSVSYMANKKIKSLLSNCILSAIKHDSQIASYYNRKIKEGKPPGIIMNNIKNKLVQRVFAVVKRKTPYVKINTYT